MGNDPCLPLPANDPAVTSFDPGRDRDRDVGLHPLLPYHVFERNARIRHVCPSDDCR